MSAMRQVYEELAESWYQHRHWSRFRLELEAMAVRWQRGRLLNIGCGHGADFLPLREGFELWGLDFASAMLQWAEKYCQKFSFSANLVLGEATKLPFAGGSFDWAIAIATYHHIKGREEREEAFRELWRVLKPGGEAFITVWNRWQPRFWLKPKEVMLPWRVKGRTFQRYFYLYSYPEVKRLLTSIGFEVLHASPEESFAFPIKTFSRNICLLVGKRENPFPPLP